MSEAFECRRICNVALLVSELKESLTRMGSDLKHGFISSLKSAWQTLNDFARAHTASAQLQAELAIVANQIEEQEKQAQEGEPPTSDSLIKSFLCCVKWVNPFQFFFFFFFTIFVLWGTRTASE